ncbi:UNKNOWN [Stylonychia lemnae]|uniref:Uncharacterized protein n=1 Tax=Stylonychia lemnae TaxID=5949 RepID=A0A078B674_STYLE|nr:UNKNOWN [Stylonychia lemnae]|eukprot:CDW88812.1 UNKNOWN [Stylonychia lemnae]
MSRLRSMKSMLDTKAPRHYQHLQNGTNAKTKQLMSKYMEMQNENRVLLKKMLHIDTKPSNLNPQRIVIKQAPSSQSLNRISRLKELIRVNQENKELLRRLQTASSTYDKGRWDKDFDHNTYFMDMIRKNSSRYIKHPYFIQTPTMNMFSSQSQHEFYQSNLSGRTMSAQPVSRLKLTQSAQGLRSSQQREESDGSKTLQPIQEGLQVNLEQLQKQRESLNSRQQNQRPKIFSPGSQLQPTSSQQDFRPMTAPNALNNRQSKGKSQRKIIGQNQNERKNRLIFEEATTQAKNAQDFETKSMSGVEPSQSDKAIDRDLSENNGAAVSDINKSKDNNNNYSSKYDQQEEEEGIPVSQEVLQMQQQLQQRPETRGGLQ